MIEEYLNYTNQNPANIRSIKNILQNILREEEDLELFETMMYEKVQRSTEPKGKRIAIWPDIDLTDGIENNKYWRDFLRTYEFDLDFERAGEQIYILQATFLCASGRRLSADFALENKS